MNEFKENCIFCKIIDKEISAYVIYEDESYIAFLDIFPRAPGHVQVIPKEHMRWVWDSNDIEGYFRIVQKIAQALQRAYGIDLIRSQIYGEEISHAHVWLWPDLPHDGTEKDFAHHAQRIQQVLE
ncbi:MAG: HIT domain-containing protein [Candidatus Pacebacteria bacterium]|nr:HIT domain-containing protein [Candidatus Paceibacterota bacterium]MCD8508068.1 HIT domain-containing protein [Candidatus Paceibacterota bacterium]MCD8528202.1 HIT domain-containing protein [Candidatus Paceibacterota bacterium]MCD8563841.1 HIT domain-containing protein [Candidatus Paceibacterota bacterium]